MLNRHRLARGRSSYNWDHPWFSGKEWPLQWARILAYITGTVDQELLLRNEYLVAEM